MAEIIPNPVKQEKPLARLATRVGLSVIFLACSLSIFLFGPNYYKLFPTNGNKYYATGLAAFFLVIALLLKFIPKLNRYWPIAYAFFIASTVILVSDLFAGYNTQFVRLFNVQTGTNPGMALAKLYDALLVIVPILLLTLLSGEKLQTLFLKKGNQHWKWAWGIGALVLFNYLTSVLIFFGTSYQVSHLGSVILWGLVFASSNSFLEELWFRGLFLKKLIPLVGVAGTIIISSFWFAALHFLSFAYLPVMVVPIFIVNTFTLGLACSVLMLKTDNIWGAFLIHAAADLFLFIATLAIH